MGIVVSSLAAIGVLLAGALLTAWLEPKMLTLLGAEESGPAASAGMARNPLPTGRDPWMYHAGPIVALLGVCWAAVCLPWGEGLIPADVNIGLFYFIVVVDFVVLGIALAGWGGNTPASVEACYRMVAQLVAYVVPLGLAILGPIMMARSLSTVDIVEAQDRANLWYVAVQPQGLALYIVTALMQTYRAPFLEPFADRIGQGVLGAAGGWRGIIWRLALSGVLFVAAAMGAVLFLGGYSGPLLPGPLWMAIKTLLIMALMLWAGRWVRLLSTADMLALSWKVLIPLGLLNVLIVGGLILLGVGQTPFPMPVGGYGPGGGGG